jgi:hypothetical protein
MLAPHLSVLCRQVPRLLVGTGGNTGACHSGSPGYACRPLLCPAACLFRCADVARLHSHAYVLHCNTRIGAGDDCPLGAVPVLCECVRPVSTRLRTVAPALPDGLYIARGDGAHARKAIRRLPLRGWQSLPSCTIPVRGESRGGGHEGVRGPWYVPATHTSDGLSASTACRLTSGG